MPDRGSEWASIVAEFERSGERHAEFCARRGVEVASFRKWLYRLRRRTARTRGARSATKAVRLLPVRVRDARADDAPVELLVRGVVVRVHVGTDAQYVAELVGSLASRC